MFETISDQSTTFGIGAFGKYYMLYDVLGAKGGFFGEGAIGFSSLSPEGADESITTFGIGFAPGLALFPSNKVGLEITFPDVLGFYTKSDDQGSGFGIGASTVSNTTVTFSYFFK